MSELRKVTLIVHGRVQGVFYRDSTMRKARELGLDGHVRNLADGTVQVVAQGRKADLERLVQWCRTGPPAAEVSDVQISYGEPEPGLEGFSVRF